MHDNTDMNEDFKLLEPMDLITKSVDELRKIIKEKQPFSCMRMGKGGCLIRVVSGLNYRLDF